MTGIHRFAHEGQTVHGFHIGDDLATRQADSLLRVHVRRSEAPAQQGGQGRIADDALVAAGDAIEKFEPAAQAEKALGVSASRDSLIELAVRGRTQVGKRVWPKAAVDDPTDFLRCLGARDRRARSDRDYRQSSDSIFHLRSSESLA